MMKHNENYQQMAERLMHLRLDRLSDIEHENKEKGITPHLSPELQAEKVQLLELLSLKWHDCPECLGVGRVRFAYTAIVAKGGYVVSRADEDQPGHTICNTHKFKSYDEAKAFAKELNTDLGWSEADAYNIITSSMFARRRTPILY